MPSSHVSKYEKKYVLAKHHVTKQQIPRAYALIVPEDNGHVYAIMLI